MLKANIAQQHLCNYRGEKPRFSPEARRANMALVEVVRAERKGSTPAQVSLA